MSMAHAWNHMYQISERKCTVGSITLYGFFPISLQQTQWASFQHRRTHFQSSFFTQYVIHLFHNTSICSDHLANYQKLSHILSWRLVNIWTKSINFAILNDILVFKSNFDRFFFLPSLGLKPLGLSLQQEKKALCAIDSF